MLRVRQPAIVSPSQANVFWIKVAGVWKQSTTWIKVAGIWKQSTPFTKVGGTWQ